MRSGNPLCQVETAAAVTAPSLPPSDRPAKRWVVLRSFTSPVACSTVSSACSTSSVGGAQTTTPYSACLHVSASVSILTRGTTPAVLALTRNPRKIALSAPKTSPICGTSQGSVTTLPTCGPATTLRSGTSPMNTTVRFGAVTSNMDSGGETMRSKKRGCSLRMSLPTMIKRSARFRVSVSVDVVQPALCSTLTLRYWPSSTLTETRN